MIQHFEDLWNECENLHTSEPLSDLSNEFKIKANLFSSIMLAKENLPEDQYKEAVGRIVGEVLFMIAMISASENINVFSSLYSVVKIKQIDQASGVELLK